MPGLFLRESNPHAEVGTTYTVPDAFRLSADNTGGKQRGTVTERLAQRGKKGMESFFWERKVETFVNCAVMRNFVVTQ